MVDDKGQSVAKSQESKETGNVFEFTLDKAKSAKALIRVMQGNNKFETPLAKVLLLKAHETALTCGQDFYAGTEAPLSCTVQGVRSVTETTPLPGAAVTVRLKDSKGNYYDLARAARTATAGPTCR